MNSFIGINDLGARRGDRWDVVLLGGSQGPEIVSTVEEGAKEQIEGDRRTLDLVDTRNKV